MRLRRETGDFKIAGTYDEGADVFVYNSIRPGLSAEDLMGEIVKIDEALGLVVSAATGNNGAIGLLVIEILPEPSQQVIIYDPATGAITGHDSGSTPAPGGLEIDQDGSGTGSGSL